MNKFKPTRRFVSVGIANGKVVINSDSHEESQALQNIMQMLGVNTQTHYEGMCG